MLKKFLSFMLCTSKIRPFSLGNFTSHWELNDNQISNKLSCGVMKYGVS